MSAVTECTSSSGERPLRLTLVIFALGSGGAERVMSILASYWAAYGHTVSLITLTDDSQTPFYALDARVRRLPLGVAGPSAFLAAGAWNSLMRVRRLRCAIAASRPDVVVSFLTETNVLTLLATYARGWPVVVAEHTDPWTCPVGAAWVWLRRWTYPWADRVVVLNERARGYFVQRVPARAVVIPNPIVVGADEERAPRAPGYVVAAMGRLSIEKRFDLLLRAFARVASQHADWTLVVLGEGPLRPALEAQIVELGIADRVRLLGAVQNPHAILRRADLYVLSSELEGFPMALAEALACGLPVVATEYHVALRDLVQDGVNGIVVPPRDAAALAAAMDHLMGDADARGRLAGHAPEIVQRFGLERVMALWADLFYALVAAKRAAA